ncbi:MAG: thioredoxin [Firmicutes bacterium]|nr:thioredoxin [Bacillota bacterium]
MAILDMNKEMFDEMMNNSGQFQGKPVLVDFWAPWCVYCKRIGPALDKIAEQFADELIVAKVNVDEQPEIAEEEGIEVLPSLVIYRDGSAIENAIAPQSKAAIEAFIKGALV